MNTTEARGQKDFWYKHRTFDTNATFGTKPTRYKNVKKAFKRVLKDAGIDDLWFHDIRHSFATAAGDSPDVSLPALAETLGHKNIKTTMIYTHATDERKRRVVDAAERFGKGRSHIGHMEDEEKERRAG